MNAMEYSFYEGIVHANMLDSYGPGYTNYMKFIVGPLLITSITVELIILFFTHKSLKLLF